MVLMLLTKVKHERVEKKLKRIDGQLTQLIFKSAVCLVNPQKKKKN